MNTYFFINLFGIKLYFLIYAISAWAYGRGRQTLLQTLLHY